MFMLAEYVNMTTVSALATTMFLGGWHAPWPISLIDGANSGWWPLLWFTAKVWGFLFLYIWLRGTLPRLRYDQFMALGWKVLIPLSLTWIMIVAITHSLRSHGSAAWVTAVINIAFLVAAVGLVVLWNVLRRRRIRDAIPPPPPPDAGAFPIPPLPGQQMMRKEKTGV
jgi:NADH-quinone oxidoreductase subunit H